MPHCESFLLRSPDSKACVCPGQFIFLNKEVIDSSDLEYGYRLVGEERGHNTLQLQTWHAKLLAGYFQLFRAVPSMLYASRKNLEPYELTKTNLWIPRNVSRDVALAKFMGKCTELLEVLEFWFEQRQLVDECYELVHLLYCTDESAEDLYTIAEQVRDRVILNLPISTIDYMRERGARLIDELKGSQTHEEAFNILRRLAKYTSDDGRKMKAVLFSACQIPSIPDFWNLSSEEVYEIIKKEPYLYSPNERLKKILREESILIADTLRIPPILGDYELFETNSSLLNFWLKGANYKFEQRKTTLLPPMEGFRTPYGDLYIVLYIPSYLAKWLVDLPSSISLSDVTYALASIKLHSIMNIYETFRLLASISMDNELDNELFKCIREAGSAAHERIVETNEEEPDALLTEQLIETAALTICFASKELQRLRKAKVTAPIYNPNMSLRESALQRILKEAEDDFDYFTKKQEEIAAQWTSEQVRADFVGFRRRHFHRLVHLLSKNQK